MSKLYEAKNYRAYLQAEIESERFGRGGKSSLARHLNVQLSFVSRVLSGEQDFTLEHGLMVSNFLGFDSKETRYFMLLLNHDRASTKDLKEYFKKDLERLKKDQKTIKGQIQTETVLSDAEMSEFFGAWYHIVIYICLRNENLRTPDSISRFLKLDQDQVNRSLKVLEKIGFAKFRADEWHVTANRYHSSKNSPAIRAHHATWRALATRSLDDHNPLNLHYSTIVSVDREAVEKIRANMLEMLKDLEPIIEKAQDKEILAINLDFFKIGQ